MVLSKGVVSVGNGAGTHVLHGDARLGALRRVGVAADERLVVGGDVETVPGDDGRGGIDIADGRLGHALKRRYVHAGHGADLAIHDAVNGVGVGAVGKAGGGGVFARGQREKFGRLLVFHVDGVEFDGAFVLAPLGFQHQKLAVLVGAEGIEGDLRAEVGGIVHVRIAVGKVRGDEHALVAFVIAGEVERIAHDGGQVALVEVFGIAALHQIEPVQLRELFADGGLAVFQRQFAEPDALDGAEAHAFFAHALVFRLHPGNDDAGTAFVGDERGDAAADGGIFIVVPIVHGAAEGEIIVDRLCFAAGEDIESVVSERVEVAIHLRDAEDAAVVTVLALPQQDSVAARGESADGQKDDGEHKDKREKFFHRLVLLHSINIWGRGQAFSRRCMESMRSSWRMKPSAESAPALNCCAAS